MSLQDGLKEGVTWMDVAKTITLSAGLFAAVGALMGHYGEGWTAVTGAVALGGTVGIGFVLLTVAVAILATDGDTR